MPVRVGRTNPTPGIISHSAIALTVPLTYETLAFFQISSQLFTGFIRHMAAAKVERLERAVNTLEAILNANDLLPASRRPTSYDKERCSCAEIRGIIVANDFSTLHKADRRYGDILTKAVEIIFKMVNHVNQDIRTYAEESLDAVLRSLLLGFNHSRVLVLLITEIGRDGAARSMICALRRLSYLIHYSKCIRIVSYGAHIFSALTSMLKRPEDSIQNAIISHSGLIFDTLGPRMKSQHSEKAYDLYCVAVNNLDLSGTPNRAAVMIIAQVSTYYPSVMNKAFLRCMVNVRDADDALNRAKLIGSLNTLKAIWPLLSEPGCTVTQDNIKIVLCSVLCCLYSAFSEVVVPCIELLERIMTNPLPWLRDFVPLMFDATTSPSPFRCKSPSSSGHPSRAMSPISGINTLPTSSLGSLCDVSVTADESNDYNVPLQLPDRSSEPAASGSSSPLVEEEIIDPLMHADLYEEVTKYDRYGNDQISPNMISPSDDSVGIVKHLPLDVCDASANCFIYTAAVLGKRFLLAGLKGLKNDREVRISHKILALNCITTISRYEDLSKTILFFGNFEQHLFEVSRFVLHDDDQLCASTVALLFSLDGYRLGNTDNVHNYQRVMRTFQPIRKRSVLQASIGKQQILDAIGLLPDAICLATTEVSSTFFLLKVTCGEFLSSLKWSLINESIRERWQEQCLIAYFDLLFSDDQKVAHAASAGLVQLVRNADFTEYSGVFAARIPDNLLSLDMNPLPSVLNMPPEFRFRGECADFVVESNLEVILNVLMDYFSMNVQQRSNGLCFTMDVLLKGFPASVYPECWGCLRKQPSSSFGFLSIILELCELNLNTPHNLSTGLRVLAALFAGYCESYMVYVVQEQVSVDRLSLPRLPEQILERLLVLPIRVLNMYYSLIAEHRSMTSQSSTSLLSRPTISPLPSKKVSPSRIADISRLLGTSIHPILPTSYLESPTLKHIFHSVDGAHRNFLERLDRDCESRFLVLLQTALDCLGTICEMLVFRQLGPQLQEILLYVKVLFEVCPDGCTTLLHQLFKVVFGKNTANINLDTLQSLRMKDPPPPLNDAEMLYLCYANDFTLFSAFINRKEYIDILILRSLGWLKTDMLSRVHNPPLHELAPALELFEGFVTLLLQVYGAFQSVSCKRAILGVMCELPRDGIIYAMADPKKVLLEAVTTQLYDPSTGNKELLVEIALYLIVLARSGVIKYDQVLRVAVELIEKAVQSNAVEIISALEVILLETLFVQRIDVLVIYSAFRAKSKSLFSLASQSTLLIWILFLHASRSDENRWSSTSIDFFAAYSEYSTDCSELVFNHSVFAVVTAFSCMVPAMYRPVDSVFYLLQNCIDKNSSLDLKLKRSVPLLFSILNNVAEEKLLMRVEQIINSPLEWLVQRIYGLLLLSTTLTSNCGLLEEYVVFLFQTIINVFKSESYPKLFASLQHRLKTADSLPLQQLLATHPAILSQWLQLLSLFSEPINKHIDLSQCNEYVSRLCASLSSSSCEPEPISSILRESPSSSELPSSCNLVEFCKSVFSGSLWCTNPRVLHLLIYLESPDIYYVYECVEEDLRACFFAHLLNAISNYLTSQMAFPDSFKAATTKSQELFDIIYDLVELEGEFDQNALRLKLFVLSRIYTVNSNELVWGNFASKEVSALLEYAAEEIKMPTCDLRATCDGLRFVLEHQSTRSMFSRDIFFGIQSVRKVILSILAFLKGKVQGRYDHISTSDKINVVVISDAVPTSDFDDFGGLDGFICALFYDVHSVCHIFRSPYTKSRDYLEKFCRVFFRHPVLHKLAIVPYTALRMNWRLRIELQENNIHVPLVNIHLLCNLDILNDFSWRLNWLGWISRQQFEDFWMSLFGVLSSTPTGNELTSQNLTNLTEQILASSVAVSVLTDILLYSLLYPEPGNPSTGRFIVKHRERNEPFYQSKSMQLLCMLKSRLIRDTEPLMVYRRNIERLNYNGGYYGLGQLSALSLWTLTGILNEENPQQVTKIDSPRLRLSLSEFLLKTTCELDTASSVRALFENFSHWFARGLDHLPLPLLSSTVRSMALLSDLFDDSASYEFLYSQMRNVFQGGYLKHHSDIGYVIYSLLKSLTVVGLETAAQDGTENDLCKQILIWIEFGLTSSSPFVREATLHGFIYLMQSMALDPLKPVVQYVTSFLQDEIAKQLSVTDPINVCDVPLSLEYTNLIWSASFRIMEEPLQISFKNNMIQRTCETFTVMNLSPNLLPVVTSGIEELTIHSASYLPQFLHLVDGCFKTYATISSTFSYALRIFIACVFKEEADPRRASAQKFEVILEELYNIYRRCDSRDAELISFVLPSVLLRLYTEERVLALILDFCFPESSGGYPGHICYSLQMMFELCERMRDSQRLSSLMTFSQHVVLRIQQWSPQSREGRAVATCLLAAVSSYEYIAYRFPVYLAALTSSESLESSYEFLLHKASEECSSSC
ncbi:hypothetical protein KIN20_032490 [Parelaphostrongylus tenuis]|uniref:Huntingtin n=1 Tax=Parelaphostrongylus tenuis TaxID=148309 RepID=A0AAD5WI39_PARTN|nr:hypothetical protein KIN20_032490 [Parelaphostrongylus tenuis]